MNFFEWIASWVKKIERPKKSMAVKVDRDLKNLRYPTAVVGPFSCPGLMIIDDSGKARDATGKHYIELCGAWARIVVNWSGKKSGVRVIHEDRESFTGRVKCDLLSLYDINPSYRVEIAPPGVVLPEWPSEKK